jgi:hypothetical protein
MSTKVLKDISEEPKEIMLLNKELIDKLIPHARAKKRRKTRSITGVRKPDV